jgi:hypothetical protein
MKLHNERIEGLTEFGHIAGFYCSLVVLELEMTKCKSVNK